MKVKLCQSLGGEHTHTHTKRSENIQILTVLLMSWSDINSNNSFEALNFMALASKKLVVQRVVLLSPNAKPSHILPPATSKMVKQFHTADAICKIVPGDNMLYLS